MSTTEDNKSPSNNIAHYLPEVAQEHPWKRAVVAPCGRDKAGRPAYSHFTFAQLDAACDRYAYGLADIGITEGMRVLIMVRPGLDFVALTFALFKIGAVPVFIDPGMGVKSFLRCAAQTEPEAFIGIPQAHVLRLIFRGSFRSVRILVTLGRPWFWGGYSINDLRTSDRRYRVRAVAEDQTAAILFTTGSTGPAKGVVYTHKIFTTQTEIIRREYGITSDDIDLPCFPLFALFSTALGATAVIPDMDPSKPALVDAAKIVEAVQHHGVTYSFGSPALWRRVCRYCMEQEIVLSSLRKVLMAGAPIPAELHHQLMFNVLTEGARTYTPYGATEALPVSNFTGAEMLAVTAAKTRKGAGMCVGLPLPEVTLRIIRISDEPIEKWDDDLVLPDGEIGEVTVKGSVVTREYHRLPDATKLAKISDGDEFWHRMGDVGYVDRKGRLWFCGRKAHRVVTENGTLYSVRCEAIFNEHQDVYRSALVGVGADRRKQTPVIVVEPEAAEDQQTSADRQQLIDELLELAQESEITRSIKHILLHPSFPVDIRHNAKIKREELAAWAEGQCS